MPRPKGGWLHDLYIVDAPKIWHSALLCNLLHNSLSPYDPGNYAVEWLLLGLALGLGALERVRVRAPGPAMALPEPCHGLRYMV